MAMGKASMGAIIAVAAAGLFLTMITSGALSANQTVPTGGTVTAVNVGVYSNSACTTNCTIIDWGTLAPGASTSKTVYVKNTGTVPVTLSMAPSNWAPSNANTYLTLTWNRAAYVLAPNTSIDAVFTLTASAGAGAIAKFNFDITITGTQ